MSRIFQEITERIQDSEKVLIGVGEEFEDKRDRVSGTDAHMEKGGRQTGHIRDWTEPFVREYSVRNFPDSEEKRILEACRVLAELVSDKDYFVVSTNQDGLTDRTDFKADRVVAPCGNRRLLQCAAGCCDTLWDASGEIGRIGKMGREREEARPPVCPKCGEKAVFNRILDAGDHYVEAGYLEQWSSYREWLSQTLNRKLVVLELGAGFEYPNIIRWPFEKVVLLNQKSVMIRVHSSLPQLPQELDRRGISVKRDPVGLFLREDS